MNERQFRHLLDKYLRGECTPEEVKLLHRFYDSFEEAPEDSSVDRFALEEVYRRIQPRIEVQEPPYRRNRYQKVFPFRRLLIAALVLLVVGLGVGGYIAYTTQPVAQVAWQERVTQPGQRAAVTLTDGTRVYLNADSRLSFPERFATDRREVTLEGEAFFEVTRQPKRPFIVTGGKLTTTVLGTSFNVKAFAHEPAEVTVATGRVKVSASEDHPTKHTVLLQPDQQAVYDGTLRKKAVDAQRWAAWREKVIQFDEVPLAEAVMVLERWFGVSIKVEDTRALSCRINGQYIDESLVNILESFRHILEIEYRTEGKKIIITGPGCP